MGSLIPESLFSIKNYWESHTLGKQYVCDNSLEMGSAEYFEHIRPWMNPYKFPEIMPRIEEAAKTLKGKHLLEVGCGMGFDSIEFLKRNIRVTATDLTEAAVEITKRNFEVNGLKAEGVKVENVLELSFPDNSFDAVWACGVLHHNANIERALSEIHRVLKTGGKAIISHFYRRPSWMYYISKLGRVNIEFEEEDPPVTEFLTEDEIIGKFDQFKIIEVFRDHYRALPIAKRGKKAILYKLIFKPIYNLILYCPKELDYYYGFHLDYFNYYRLSARLGAAFVPGGQDTRERPP